MLKNIKMNEDTLDFVSDAKPQPIVQDLSTNLRARSEIHCVLDFLSHNEYKSIFFLLLEKYIELKCFRDLVKKDKNQLRGEFLRLYERHQFSDEMLYELFGTIKRFDILKKLGTCFHILKVKFLCEIKDIWKLFYSLCEEMTDTDRMKLECRLFPCSSHEDLNSAEELFCAAILEKRLNKTNISHLEEIFIDMPACQSLIKSYLDAKRSVDYYEIKSPTVENPCGIAVIFNHVTFYQENNELPCLPDRKGSNFDVAHLKCLWKDFGFKTTVYENKTDSDVLEIFINLAKQDHTCYDAFIACYLSHGDKDIVYASNSKAIPITTLKDIMGNRCRTLQNKPKLFFIQACQGQNVQSFSCHTELITQYPIRQSLTTAVDYTPLQDNIPLFGDILTVMSTIPGYISFRSEGSGTWFIQALVSELQTSGEYLTIVEICEKVTNSVSKERGTIPPFINCKQTVATDSTLRKQLKLKKLRL